MNTVTLSLPRHAIDLVKTYLLQLQQNICTELEELDGQTSFIQDPWEREQGGGGISCILANGKIFAKAGVNFSHIWGSNLPPTATASRSELSGHSFHALGVSVVCHPQNPYVPTTHANVRFFVAEKQDAPSIWWFGGGFDLTPYYGFHEDCRHWHATAQQACQPFGEDLYSRLKSWCDRYFYLKHREEARGIGGLFFDDYQGSNFEQSFAFLQSIGNHFMKAYAPIVIKRREIPYGTREKSFQLYRRGRYVEFNLVYDRGTLFGLQSGGRTESILMSLPPEVNWHYNWQPEPGSKEAELYTEFLPAKAWV